MFLTEEQFLTKIPHKFDNTIRTTFESCPRKYYWFGRGVDYAQRPAYFTWGTAWGLILNSWYSDPRRLTTSFEDEWFSAARDAETIGVTFWDNSGTSDLGVNTRESLRYKWARYIQTYPIEDWTPIISEAGFLWPISTINGIDCFLGGAIDAYIEWQPYGTLLLENKSSSINIASDKYADKYAFSSQITTYIWYLTQMLNQEIFGALVNSVSKRVPGPRTRSEVVNFTRNLEKRNTYELKEFERDFAAFIHRIWLAYETNHFPKTTNDVECTGGPGKAPCLYRPLCKAVVPPKDINPFNYSDMAPRSSEWEPWDRKGEN